MANNCFYDMMIVGTKENAQTFVDRISYKDEHNPKNFGRIYSCDVYSETELDNGLYAIRVTGDCAWSIASAMGNDCVPDYLAKNTKELDLILEAWSEETGMAFQEHFIYDKGIHTTSECREIYIYFWDKNDYKTYDEFKAAFIKDYGETEKDKCGFPTENEFEETDEVIHGGWNDDGSWCEYTIV